MVESEHASAETLDAWCVGALGTAQVQALEKHCAQCAQCSERLTRSAHLETIIATHFEGAVVRRSQWRAIAVVAAAAGVVVALASQVQPTPARAPVICADGPGQRACVSRAHARGFFVRYPAWAGAPQMGLEGPGVSDRIATKEIP